MRLPVRVAGVAGFGARVWLGLAGLACGTGHALAEVILTTPVDHTFTFSDQSINYGVQLDSRVLIGADIQPFSSPTESVNFVDPITGTVLGSGYYTAGSTTGMRLGLEVGAEVSGGTASSIMPARFRAFHSQTVLPGQQGFANIGQAIPLPNNTLLSVKGPELTAFIDLVATGGVTFSFGGQLGASGPTGEGSTGSSSGATTTTTPPAGLTGDPVLESDRFFSGPIDLSFDNLPGWAGRTRLASVGPGTNFLANGIGPTSIELTNAGGADLTAAQFSGPLPNGQAFASGKATADPFAKFNVDIDSIANTLVGLERSIDAGVASVTVSPTGVSADFLDLGLVSLASMSLDLLDVTLSAGVAIEHFYTITIEEIRYENAVLKTSAGDVDVTLKNLNPINPFDPLSPTVRLEYIMPDGLPLDEVAFLEVDAFPIAKLETTTGLVGLLQEELSVLSAELRALGFLVADGSLLEVDPITIGSTSVLPLYQGSTTLGADAYGRLKLRLPVQLPEPTALAALAAAAVCIASRPINRRCAA